MAPKKVTDKAIETELVATVRRLYAISSEDLTVNNTRQAVETKLKLDDGFLSTGDWKKKSKQIIYDALTEAQEEAPPTQATELEVEAEPSPAPKNSANVRKKRAAKKQPSPPPASESELSELDEPSEASDFSEVSEKPTKKRAATKRGAKKRKALSDDDDDGDEEEEESGLSTESEVEEPPKKKSRATPTKSKASKPAKKAAPPKKEKVVESGSDSLLSEIPDDDLETPDAVKDVDSKSPEDEDNAELEGDAINVSSTPKKSTAEPADESGSEMSIVFDPSPKKKRKSKGAAATKPAAKPKRPATKPADDDDESEISEVIDDPPKRTRKSKEPAAAKPARKTKAKAAAAELSPDEAQIKQLQSHLVRCGVRKIWAFELKKYGDNNKAKIKHLRDMLTELGMVGRFSESKAKEIKEKRELLADLDAVKEGEKSWGLGATRPSRRRVVKPLKELSDDEDDDEDQVAEGATKAKTNAGRDDGDSNDEDTHVKVRGSGAIRARQGLAFLDDESESD
ncbi:hypothetical protein B0T22DRAFT_171580 [Podospora appendiculata]|uniref:Transcriptional regulator n=1 Tax=Podospora appendiculata TaxID=314037 RepID=A0AAE0XBS2_9PEZI|nr:hypothetical protein B0T22DRAFT_171580 [Podospora appendiculata]